MMVPPVFQYQILRIIIQIFTALRASKYLIFTTNLLQSAQLRVLISECKSFIIEWILNSIIKKKEGYAL